MPVNIEFLLSPLLAFLPSNCYRMHVTKTQAKNLRARYLMHPHKDYITDLENTLAIYDAVPVLNPTVMKIQQEATRKDLHFSLLASLIRKDPAMTSQVLKVANSPYCRGIEEARTLKDALTRLGQKEICQYYNGPDIPAALPVKISGDPSITKTVVASLCQYFVAEKYNFL